jgi:hypothetical protein
MARQPEEDEGSLLGDLGFLLLILLASLIAMIGSLMSKED